VLKFENIFLTFVFVNVASERLVVRGEEFESRLREEFEIQICLGEKVKKNTLKTVKDMINKLGTNGINYQVNTDFVL